MSTSVKDNYYFVYILTCADDSLYCGITNKLDDRIKTHNLGKGAKYTKGRLPVTLSYFEKLENKSLALKREIEIKKYTREIKLNLINIGKNISP